MNEYMEMNEINKLRLRNIEILMNRLRNYYRLKIEVSDHIH